MARLRKSLRCAAPALGCRLRRRRLWPSGGRRGSYEQYAKGVGRVYRHYLACLRWLRQRGDRGGISRRRTRPAGGRAGFGSHRLGLKGVVSGKSWSVLLVLGGRRIIKKNKR